MLEAGHELTVSTDYSLKGNKDCITMSYAKLAQAGAAAHAAGGTGSRGRGGCWDASSCRCYLAAGDCRFNGAVHTRRAAVPHSPSPLPGWLPTPALRSPTIWAEPPAPFFLSQDVKKGSTILCADGSISLEVLDTDPKAGTVRVKCLNTATLG